MVTISIGADNYREILVDDAVRQIFHDTVTAIYTTFLQDLRRTAQLMTVHYGVTEEEADTELRRFFADRLTSRLKEKFNE